MPVLDQVIEGLLAQLATGQERVQHGHMSVSYRGPADVAATIRLTREASGGGRKYFRAVPRRPRL